MHKWFLLLFILLLLSSCSWDTTVLNDSTSVKTEIIEEKTIPNSAVVEREDTDSKIIEISSLWYEIVDSYTGLFWEDVTWGEYLIYSVNVENIWNEPYTLNSWIGMTEWWIQLVNNWKNYNNVDFNWEESTNNPWDTWVYKYIFDVSNIEVDNPYLLAKKMNIKNEVKIK